jgi:hypothetical protein
MYQEGIKKDNDSQERDARKREIYGALENYAYKRTSSISRRNCHNMYDSVTCTLVLVSIQKIQKIQIKALSTYRY